MTRPKVSAFSLLIRLVVIGATLVPGIALGDVIMPSFVDMICAPLPSITGTMGLAAIVACPH